MSAEMLKLNKMFHFSDLEVYKSETVDFWVFVCKSASRYMYDTLTGLL